MRRPVRSTALLSLGLALAAVALGAHAGELYQWKDAKGVTHYSDAPPPGQKKHTTRRIDQRAAPVAAAKPVVNADCSNARNNLTLLQGTAKLGVDVDNDGKLDRELTAAERAGRLKMAEGQIEIYCDAPAANAAATAAAAKTR